MIYWLLGKVLPSIPEDFHKQPEFNREDDFSREEVKKLNLVGLNLQLKHKSNLISGEVINQYNNKDGSKWIIASVNTDRPLGKMTINMIESDIWNLNEFSLGHNVKSWIDWEKLERKVEKTPMEVSLLPKARRECGTCKIHHIISNQKLKSKIGTYIECASC